MDNAKQHWPILRELGTDLENKVREFMVTGWGGDGVIVATEDGLAFWFGKMQFGLGKSKTATIPTQLSVSGLVCMAQGQRHFLLLNKRGKIYTMGMNNRGQLGLGTADQQTRFSPQLIPSPNKFISVRCGRWHSLALTEDGKVWAWGLNANGQVDVPSSFDPFPFFSQILKLDHHRVVAVECGGYHSLALTDQGEVYAWGLNCYGQLGDESWSSKHIPTRIPTSSSVKSMAAGSGHTLLLTKTGEVYACGYNGYGQLGLPTTTESSARLSKVAGLPSISQIASHPLTDLSIAMSSDHRCFVWGKLAYESPISTPRELPPVYSTVQSPLSLFSPHRSTPHSFLVPAKECSSRTDLTMQIESRPDSVLNQTSPNPILDQMFNNPNSSPDIRFQVEDQTILAHRNVLQISSGHFRRLFSSRTANLNRPSLVSLTFQFGSSRSQHTTNKSKPNSALHCTQDTIFIPDHSYAAFHAYLRFLYLGILEVSSKHLIDLFALSVSYKESNLRQLCLLRMSIALTLSSCSLYPSSFTKESQNFQLKLVQIIVTKFLEVIGTVVCHSMKLEICKQKIRPSQ